MPKTQPAKKLNPKNPSSTHETQIFGYGTHPSGKITFVFHSQGEHQGDEHYGLRIARQ
jgi:hypothetical protein